MLVIAIRYNIETREVWRFDRRVKNLTTKLPIDDTEITKI
jgi:hypothetical protein